jgi:Nucleotidyl transferase AbiEii toxin, Type IV TA system
VGGTALSLYWGHRLSIDLDFFMDKNIDLDKLEEKVNGIDNSTNRKKINMA